MTNRMASWTSPVILKRLVSRIHLLNLEKAQERTEGEISEPISTDNFSRSFAVKQTR